MPLLTSVPTMPRISPTTIIATPLIGEPWPTVDAAIRPSSISAQYSAGPNLSATSASKRREQHQQHDADRRAPERGHALHEQRDAAPALLRHRVAVEHVDGRGRMARHAEQDGAGAAAVVGAEVHAGQHDERAGRRQVVGDRQQQRDRDQRAQAGQHADQAAEEDADEAVPEVAERDRFVNAEGEVGTGSR